jgi:hypothetical protein
MIHAAVAERAGVILGHLDSLLTGRVYASIEKHDRRFDPI